MWAITQRTPHVPDRIPLGLGLGLALFPLAASTTTRALRIGVRIGFFGGLFLLGRKPVPSTRLGLQGSLGCLDLGQPFFPESQLRRQLVAPTIYPILLLFSLVHLDLALTRWGYKVVRYADDLVVLCESQNKTKTALGLLKQMAEGELRLMLHPEKTRIPSFAKGFDFLGFTFKGRHRVARQRALEEFKDRVRQLTLRQIHHTLREVIAERNPVIQGWDNYFWIGHMKGRFET